MAWTKTERAEARRILFEDFKIKPNDSIYTKVTHVSRSGMSRKIQAFMVRDDDIVNITRWVAAVNDDRYDRDSREITVNGCGMDMCFDLVYRLGHYLWPEGTPEPHGTRNGEPDRDGGYALNKRDL